jgi:SAM-dependent methyltransferase
MERDPGREFFETHYWTFLRVRSAYAAAAQPLLRYWTTPELNEYDGQIYRAIETAEVVLDVGAGDGTMKRKMVGHGFRGDYLTLDPSQEFEHDFATLAEVPDASTDAIVCLEVIEHIRLESFFGFLDEMLAKLREGGRLVISTPNADYVAGIWSSDFTHVHAYRSVDLAALLHLHGFESAVYRIAWRAPHDPLRERVRFQLARVLTRGILQVDYARGILVIATPSSAPRLPSPAKR